MGEAQQGCHWSGLQLLVKEEARRAWCSHSHSLVINSLRWEDARKGVGAALRGTVTGPAFNSKRWEEARKEGQTTVRLRLQAQPSTP